MYFFMIPCRYQ